MGTGAKGTISNPYTMAEFEELADAGLWQGGYVRHGAGPGSIIYHRSYDDQNAASGCGSGCGSIYGNGNILSGSDRVIINGITIFFSWSEGTANNGVGVTIDSVDGYAFVEWAWIGNYTIRISSTKPGITTDTYDYPIPEFYRVQYPFGEIN